MAERSNMRASNADRVQIADDLRRAFDEGRLLAHEFDERLGKVLNARTYGEFDAIVSDLPRGRDLAERPGHAGTALRARWPGRCRSRGLARIADRDERRDLSTGGAPSPRFHPYRYR